MIQDISPSRLDNSFENYTLSTQDYLLFFDNEGRILSKIENGGLSFNTGIENYKAIYLFSVDDKRYFLSVDERNYLSDEYEFRSIRELRDICTGKELFAAFTAYHLWKWYNDNIYCGKCGEKLVYDTSERAMYCCSCKSKIYPRINPAVIVGVTNGDSLLITRYKHGYAHNALVAGFTEIGETLEQTVEREVMEETGIKVKNIRYYKSQPWGMSQDILIGFFCDAYDGCDIHMDENELKYAQWVKREDIVLQPNNLSLTNEMMKVFKENL